MPDENLYSLLIRVEGGDAAAAEIIKSKYALKSVEDESDAIKGKFNEGFQHVALKGFIADAARSIGLGTELRPVISMLSMGLSELGTTGLNPLLLGFAALAGLSVVVYNHFKSHTEELGKTLAGYKDNVAAVNDYVAAGGRLSASLQAVRAQEEAAAKALTEKMAKTTAARLADEQATVKSDEAIVALHRRQEAVMGADGSTKSWTHALEDAKKAVVDDTAMLEANEHGFATWQDYVKSGTQSLDKLSEAHKKAAAESKKASDQMIEDTRKFMEEQKRAADEIASAAEKMKASEQSMAEKIKLLQDDELASVKNGYEKKTAEIQKYKDEKLRSLEVYQKEIEAARSEGFDVTAMEAQKAAYITQLNAVVAQKTRENYNEMEQAARTAFSTIGNVAASAAAKIVMGHTNAREQVLLVEKQMEQDALTAGFKMVENWALQQAKKLVLSQTTDAGVTAATQASTAAQVAASAQATAAIHTQTAAVVALTTALAAATTQALALDAALAVAAA